MFVIVAAIVFVVPLSPASSSPPPRPVPSRLAADGAPSDADVADHARRVALLERIERRYRRYRTVTGRFVQVTHLRDQDRTLVTRGALKFKRSGRFRFDVDGGGWVASDGRTLRAYDPEAKTVYVSRAKGSLYPPVFGFLEGEATLQKAFSWRLLETPAPSAEPDTPPAKAPPKARRRVALVGRPKTPTPMVALLVLWVEETTGRLRRVMVVDAEGNTNRFSFVAMRAGAKLSDRVFRPRRPRGARVVEP